MSRENLSPSNEPINDLVSGIQRVVTDNRLVPLPPEIQHERPTCIAGLNFEHSKVGDLSGTRLYTGKWINGTDETLWKGIFLPQEGEPTFCTNYTDNMGLPWAENWDEVTDPVEQAEIAEMLLLSLQITYEPDAPRVQEYEAALQRRQRIIKRANKIKRIKRWFNGYDF